VTSTRFIYRHALRNRTSPRALLIGLAASLAFAPAAIAQTVSTATNSTINLDLGSVLATGATPSDGDASIPGTAANKAPTRASLKETQPTSVISSQFVARNLSPLSNYTDIMAISPSVSENNNQGPGVTESHNVQLRGFQDGQYNVTFDGIPYGDSNDFTHHSTTFFAAHDVGATIVDRGPGTASTVGDATFGGTVAIISKDPASTAGITSYGSYGSWQTYQAGAEGDTGVFGPYGTSAMIDGAYSGSNTYDTNARLRRSNVFAKAVQPLNSTFVLTAEAMYNDTYQRYTSGATLGDIAAYGRNYGLSNDPLSQNYWGYNTDHYKTDFEYLDLRGDLGNGWTVDGKIYTYAYYHHSLNGDNNWGCSPDDESDTCNAVNNSKTWTGLGQTVSGTVVPGQFKFNTYRSFGTIDRIQKDFTAFGISGDVKLGAWFDSQANTRALIDQNLYTGANAVATAQYPYEPFERLMHDSLTTFQPYFQVDLHPIEGLTISPGVKWNYFRRGINAAVNQKTYDPLGYTKVYQEVTPSIEANYLITPDLSVYAQYAKGFLAPNLNLLYSTNPGGSSVNPQTTDNYQAGIVYQSARFSGDFDAYYIPFGNYINSEKTNGVTYFYNNGGTTFEGLEAEGTYVLGYGVDLYANGSLNSAKTNGTKGKIWVAETPQATAAFGVLYDNGTFNGSIMDKWVGGKYGASNNTQWMDPYNLVNLEAGLDLATPGYGSKPIELNLQVDNITNQTQIFDYAGSVSVLNAAQTAYTSQNTYYTLAGRSALLTVTVPLGY
jgi:iron complex outermembrane receptor protein